MWVKKIKIQTLIIALVLVTGCSVPGISTCATSLYVYSGIPAEVGVTGQDVEVSIRNDGPGALRMSWNSGKDTRTLAARAAAELRMFNGRLVLAVESSQYTRVSVQTRGQSGLSVKIQSPSSRR